MKMIVYTNNITSYLNILSKAVFALNLLRSEFDAEAEYRQRMREQAEERSGDKVSWLPYSTNMIDQLDKYVCLTQQIWLHNLANMIAPLKKYDWSDRQMWLRTSTNMITLLDKCDYPAQETWLPYSTNIIDLLDKYNCPTQQIWLPYSTYMNA